MQRNFVAACAGIGAELLKHRMNGLPWQAVLVRESARVGVHVPEPEARIFFKLHENAKPSTTHT